eukprot:4450279-Lingulodinium_polyedra.AAC.1
MFLLYSGPVGRKRIPPCTPAAMQHLPPEAVDDLRRSFRSLETTLGIPAPDFVVPAAIPAAPPPAAALDAEDPLNEVALPDPPEERLPDDGNAGGAFGLRHAETLVPLCPAVAFYGKALSDSLLAWWERWAGKSTCTSYVAVELRKIGR